MSMTPGQSDVDSQGAAPHPSLGEILEVVLPHVAQIEEGFVAIRVALDALHQHVTADPHGGPAVAEKADSASSPPAPMPVTPQVEPVPEQPATSQPAAVPAPQELPQQPPAPEPPPVGDEVTISVGGGNWSQIMFGDKLTIDPSISALSGALLADVYRGSFDAMALMGCLLTFRSESGDRKPRLLKDMGEAFYRWKPGDDPTLRDALIRWVHAELDDVGVGNRITLVQVGDRYDMQRHNAKERGVEVAEVQGWIVLRDNGKVYSKANVVVR